MLVRRLSFPLLVLLLTGCSATASDASAERFSDMAPETLPQAQALWNAKAPSAYQVTVTQTCFCPPELRQPLRVSVVDGDVVEVKGLEQPLKQRDQLDNYRLTIAGVFRFIETSAARKPHKLEVEYDPSFGFPRRIKYDGHEMIADDEIQYTLTDFSAGDSD
ncbi:MULTISPECIES: DUF6174 domain-containing protein [Marinobacter]|uniref:DUF6174 domain-containing protein n=1 Tax=Marinobacter TaxID=2742 RepID=UPI001245121E|nr:MULTISPECIES: DUF6174 domain-containing protein [Marinobacter]MBL3555497.1 hypothetical protein [Marinobacter sp. JB05H06]